VVENYKLLPLSLVPAATFALGLTELLAAVAVFVPLTHQAAVVVLATLLLLYMLAMAINISRGRAEIDCGCAGPAHQQEISSALLWRNLLLIAVAYVAFEATDARSLVWLDYLAIAAGGAASCLLYHIVNLLLSNQGNLIKLRAL
jgi:uncharacterized membrane protein